MTIPCNKNITKQLNSYSYVIAITLQGLLQRTKRALCLSLYMYNNTAYNFLDTDFEWASQILSKRRWYRWPQERNTTFGKLDLGAKLGILGQWIVKVPLNSIPINYWPIGEVCTSTLSISLMENDCLLYFVT